MPFYKPLPLPSTERNVCLLSDEFCELKHFHCQCTTGWQSWTHTSVVQVGLATLGISNTQMKPRWHHMYKTHIWSKTPQWSQNIMHKLVIAAINVDMNTKKPVVTSLQRGYLLTSHAFCLCTCSFKQDDSTSMVLCAVLP